MAAFILGITVAVSSMLSGEELKPEVYAGENIHSAETNGGDWMQQSLPLGNGNLGNLIFGGISKERIHFNEKTLWTGGPSASRPGYQFGNKDTAYTAEEIEAYRQVLDDKSKNVFNDSISGYGMGTPIRFPGESNLNKGSYQDFGDIWLDFSAMGMNDTNVSNYRRELDLQTGIASTVFTYEDAVYKREHFVSSPDQVMVTYVTASEPGKLDVTIQMELNNSGLSGDISLDPAQNTCTISGYVKDNGLKFYTTMKVIPIGGTLAANMSNNTYSLEDADSFMIVMAAETDYKNDYPVYRDLEKNLSEVVNNRVAAGAEKIYDELKNRHVMDHQGLFDRVALDLKENKEDIPTNELVQAYRNGEYSKYLEVLAFQFGRYLTIAGSRGTLPSNLVGLWTVGDSAWTGDYHFNVNVQMNYWPVYVTNLAECGVSMVEYMESLREPGRLTAQCVHGITDAVENHTGFTVHTENNPFGMTAPTNAQEYGWNPTGAAWAIQNIWAHYEFTQDEEYLKDVIYPIMKEAALFWDRYLWTSGYQVINDETSPYHGENRLVVAPSFSEEQGPTAVGTTYDQSLVWELYKECIEAGEITGEDPALLVQWKENMQKLDPIEINATNGIKEWYEETRVGTESGHHKSYAKAGDLAEIPVPNSGWNIGHLGEQRHASHLVGLYPGTLINKDNEVYMSAAIQSLTERGVYSTGWSKANKINLWARTGEGNQAYRVLNNLIGGNSSGLQYNLFDSHGSGGGETMKNGSPVWQIDGNYGLTSGVAEMLLQSQLDYIQLLPAIPDAWADGSVEGLVARGNFEIDMMWADRSLVEATILSKNGGECEVEYYTLADATVVEVNGDVETPVAVTKLAGGRIQFATEKDKVYKIKEIPEKPANAPANGKVVAAGTEAIISCDPVADATEYKIYASADNANYEVIAASVTNEYKDTNYTSGKTYKISAVVSGRESIVSNMIRTTVVDFTGKIDDRDGRIQYSGFDDWSENAQYMGTEKYSTGDGATAEFYFVGNRIDVIGMKNKDCYTFDLYIDGEIAGNYNTNGSAQRQAVLATVDNLTDGLHKVKLVVTKSKVSLDAFAFNTTVIGMAEIVGEDTLNMRIASGLQLSAEYIPAGAYCGGVNWSVDNLNIASIDENGLLTPLKPGTVVVTAADKLNPEYTAKKTITITDEIVEQRIDAVILAKNAKANSEQNPASGNDGPAAWAFDDENHMWHSRYSGTPLEGEVSSGVPSESNPIWIQTGFDKEWFVSAIEYTGRDNGNNLIGDYEILAANLENPQATPVDSDFTKIKEGKLEHTSATQRIELGKTVAATHIRMKVLSKQSGGSGEVVAKNISIFGYDTLADAAGYTLSLDGNIGVNYHMQLGRTVLKDTGAYMNFKLGDREYTKVSVADATTKTVDGITYHVFKCEVPVKDMETEITGQIMLSDGRNSSEFKYTVKEYADTIADKIDKGEVLPGAAPEIIEATVELVEAMSDFGNCTSTYFANGTLTETGEMKEVTVETLEDYKAELPKDSTYYASSLLLKSDTIIRHYFTEKVTDSAVKKGDLYYIEVEGIPAHKLGTEILTTVGDMEIAYSPLSYAYIALSGEGVSENLKSVMRAMYLYYEAAQEYLNATANN